MVVSLCDVGPAGRMYPRDGAGPQFSTSSPGIRHESSEDESARATHVAQVARSLGLRRQPVAVARWQELEELAVGIPDEEGVAEVALVDDGGAVLDGLLGGGPHILDRDRQVGEPGLVHRARPEGRAGTG